MRRLQSDTIVALKKKIVELGSQRAAAREINVAQRVLSDIVNGRAAHVSAATESTVRIALGLPVVVMVEVPACPDCGSAHTGRCHGKPVATVRVVRPRRFFTRWADAPVSALATAIKERFDYGD